MKWADIDFLKLQIDVSLATHRVPKRILDCFKSFGLGQEDRTERVC